MSTLYADSKRQSQVLSRYISQEKRYTTGRWCDLDQAILPFSSGTFYTRVLCFGVANIATTQTQCIIYRRLQICIRKRNYDFLKKIIHFPEHIFDKEKIKRAFEIEM